MGSIGRSLDPKQEGALLWDLTYGIDKRVSAVDNEALIRPFSLEEVSGCLKEMRNNTAPGPDVFPVTFYKKFWGLIRPQFVELINNFTRGGEQYQASKLWGVGTSSKS